MPGSPCALLPSPRIRPTHARTRTRHPRTLSRHRSSSPASICTHTYTRARTPSERAATRSRCTDQLVNIVDIVVRFVGRGASPLLLATATRRTTTWKTRSSLSTIFLSSFLPRPPPLPERLSRLVYLPLPLPRPSHHLEPRSAPLSLPGGHAS